MTTKRRQSSRTKKVLSATSTDIAASKPIKAAPRSKHYTRPGVEAAARLVSLRPLSDHVTKWEKAASYYPAMITAKGGAKLAKLDKQRDDLLMAWTSGDGKKIMTKDQVIETKEQLREKREKSGQTELDVILTKKQLLEVIIEWKFGKGKPRHALKPLLKSNSDEEINVASISAFAAADEIPIDDPNGDYKKQISQAINHLCELKGVGPATASALLSLYAPENFAFMDDEVIECLYDGKRGYTLKIYLELNQKCREIAGELNAAMGTYLEWTSARVGKALWTVATMAATNDQDRLSAIFDREDVVDTNSVRGSDSNEENVCSSLMSGKRAKKGRH